LTRTEYNQMLWNKNHRININNIIERQCSNCGEWKEENTSFYLQNKSYPERGFNSWCKKCMSDKTGIRQKANYDTKGRPYQQAWRDKDDNRETVNERKRQWSADHQDHVTEYELDYYKNNPDKFLIYTQNHRIHDITEGEWRKELVVFRYECAYCGISEKQSKIIYKQVLHKDHVDCDGYNDLRNAVPACLWCNSHKHDLDMWEWYNKQDFFNEDKYSFIIWWTTEGYKGYIDNKLPYRITKKQNEDKKTFHYELWTVDEKRNLLECIDIKDKKNQLDLSLIENSL